jgi:hypothetical protein
MKILKSKTPLNAERLSKFVNDNQIAKEDIFAIVPDGTMINLLTLFYYEEPKPEDEKKGFWG